MKTIKWLWVASLLTIGFKLYNLVLARPRGSDPDDMQSFMGMGRNDKTIAKRSGSDVCQFPELSGHPICWSEPREIRDR